MYAKNQIQCASMEVTGPNVVDGCAEGGAGDNGGEQDYCVEGSGGSATDRTAENHTGHIKMKKRPFSSWKEVFNQTI
ncbi:hypothetical protein [Paenibacillus sp. FSL R10-2736]|uniref:hypothetical protein n=1 Tax=Paenibacillus sp. FSL R10-2736 TaxID=2954692 RepID=UPI0030FBA694